MNIQSPAVRHEQMRIAGSLVDTDEHSFRFVDDVEKVAPSAAPPRQTDAGAAGFATSDSQFSFWMRSLVSDQIGIVCSRPRIDMSSM